MSDQGHKDIGYRIEQALEGAMDGAAWIVIVGLIALGIEWGRWFL